jgi:sucrose-phosphate synthase
MFSIHGLIRSRNLEMGRDADTGGQITYVLELCKALSEMKEVGRVDLFTRLIMDKTVSEDYAAPIEEINDKFRIVRIQCGGRKYLRKELLWPHLSEFIDKTLKFIKKEGPLPDIVHGHYADAGYVAMNLAKTFGIPFIFTGHSLGRPKFQKLRNEGLTEEDIIRKYKIDTRIDSEENILSAADLIVTSTHQEIEEQYGLYTNKDAPVYQVIPPGLDIQKFYPYYHNMMPEFNRDEEQLFAHASVMQELNRFFTFPEKPIILALCRPDKRKNISGLIRAYGEDASLKAIANLAVFAGIRKDIADMEENEREVLTEILLLMDKYDLYGKMAIPKKHNFDLEVPELYRIAAEKKGVFVNAALTEPFGLTLLEASACGLPIVATHDGGPRDIIKNCDNGILIDPTEISHISKAIKKILTENHTWETYSKNGVIKVREHYTWKAHISDYLMKITETQQKQSDLFFPAKPMLNLPMGRRLTRLNHLLVTDIDNTLISEKDNTHLESLVELLNQQFSRLGFVTASGRTIDSTVEILTRHGVQIPDIIISSVGSEIYYGRDLAPDEGWARHITHKWDREKIRTLLKDFSFLEYQEEETQRRYKISYFLKSGKDQLPQIHDCLIHNRCRYNLIYSSDNFLDILPYRASKGKAIRYLSYKWEIPLENMLICGDSGNDEEMLRGDPLGVVVGNYSPELDRLRGMKNIYFSSKNVAQGILDGIDFYQFLSRMDRESSTATSR